MSSSNRKHNPFDIEMILNSRAEVHQLLGQVITVLSAVPRYRVHPIADLVHMVIDPLLRGRISTAKPKSLTEQTQAPGGLSGIIIWATVSDSVKTKLQTQIEAEVFPIRLFGDEWASGEHFWILDVVAPTADVAKMVLAQFYQANVKTEFFLHPHLTRLLDEDFTKTVRLAENRQYLQGKTIN